MSHPEKLSEDLGLRVTPTTARHLRGLAELARVTPSELVRHLIDEYIQKELEMYQKRQFIFGDAQTK